MRSMSGRAPPWWRSCAAWFRPSKRPRSPASAWPLRNRSARSRPKLPGNRGSRYCPPTVARPPDRDPAAGDALRRRKPLPRQNAPRSRQPGRSERPSRQDTPSESHPEPSPPTPVDLDAVGTPDRKEPRVDFPPRSGAPRKAAPADRSSSLSDEALKGFREGLTGGRRPRGRRPQAARHAAPIRRRPRMISTASIHAARRSIDPEALEALARSTRPVGIEPAPEFSRCASHPVAPASVSARGRRRRYRCRKRRSAGPTRDW